jgi:hypothetical protein
MTDWESKQRLCRSMSERLFFFLRPVDFLIQLTKSIDYTSLRLPFEVNQCNGIYQ